MDRTVLLDKSSEPSAQLWASNSSLEFTGGAFLRALMQSGIPITDAFWTNFSEDEPRQLYIATPLIDLDGLRRTAGRFHEVLYSLDASQRGGLHLGDVSIVSPFAREIQYARNRYPFYRNPLHQMVLESADSHKPFIYFLKLPDDSIPAQPGENSPQEN